jgi:hypothetical protein
VIHWVRIAGDAVGDPFGRDDRLGELAQRRQLGEPEGVVAVGLPLGVLELPRLSAAVFATRHGTPSSPHRSWTHPDSVHASMTTHAK